MRHLIFLLAVTALLSGRGRSSEQNGAAQGTSGSGQVYGRGSGRDDQQRAAENATDMRPRGGSMEGAGGAGPGYDGSGKGLGEHGTVPAPGSGVGAGLTNSAASTNGAVRSSPPPPQQR